LPVLQRLAQSNFSFWQSTPWYGRHQGRAFSDGFRTVLPRREAKKKVDVLSFYIQHHEVTNAQFEAFVKSTGYVTVAERALDAKQFPRLSEAERNQAHWFLGSLSKSMA